MPRWPLTKTEDVVQTLRQRLQTGYYGPGGRLPATRQLAVELQVSLQTIRTAVQRLETENLINIVPCSGIYALPLERDELLGPPMAPFTKHPTIGLVSRMPAAGVQEMGFRFLVSPYIIRAESDIARVMNLEEGTELFHRSRVYLVNHVPYRLVEEYVLASFWRGTPAYDLSPFDRWQLYASQDSPVIGEHLKIRHPSTIEAKTLSANARRPVWDLTRLVLVNTTAWEYTHIVAIAALHEFVNSYVARQWPHLALE